MARCRASFLFVLVAISMLLAAHPIDAAAAAKKKVTSKPTAATAPTSITSPANGAIVSGIVPITVTLGTGTVWVNVWADGVYVGSTPPSTFNWDSTKVANANHTFRADAYAGDGTLLGQAFVTVTVQNANETPALTVTSPTNMSTVSGNVTITAVVNASVEWVDFNIDGPIFAASPPYSVTWDSTSVPDGPHSIEVSAYDRSSNQIGDVIVSVTVANHVTTGAPITLRSTSTASTTALSGADRVTINAPAGVSPGDVLIAQIASTGNTRTLLTGPPGWILAAHNDAGSTVVQAVFYHVVPASPPEPASYTWTWLGTLNDAAGGIADYVGVDNLNPLDDINGAANADTASITAPAVSIPTGHTTDRLVAMFSANSSAGTKLPAALAPQWNFHAISWGVEVAMGDLNLSSATATAQTATLPGGAAWANGQELALLPAGVSNVAFADRTSSNAPGVSISGSTVTALVPFGSDDTDPSNAANVVIENSTGTLPAPVIINTDRVDACATFASTGNSICSGQGGNVNFIPNGATTATRVFDGDTGPGNEYTGGSCAGCGMAADDFLGLGILASQAGFQLLNPANNTVATPIPGNGEPVPVDFGYDPIGHRILAANYKVTDPNTFASSPPLFEIFNLYRSGTEVFDLLNPAAFFLAPGHTCTGSGSTVPNDGLPDSNAIDTSTNIAYVTFHSPAVCFNDPSEDIALFDLKQAAFTTTGTDGGWDTAGKQVQTLTGLNLGGITAISVVSGAHLAVVSDQFSPNGYVGALKLPATSGSGTPAIQDWVDVRMPADPSGKPWVNWHQPSGLGSYTSPNNGKAMGVIMNFAEDSSSNPIGPTYLAIVDLQALLNAPRDSSNHAVATSVNLVTSGIVRFVKVQ
jgi:hypothetical protein